MFKITGFSEKKVALGAWLCFFMAVPLRLIYFSGYGLGDDPYIAQMSLNILLKGDLDFNSPLAGRPLFFLPQILSFHLFGMNDASFVAPIFIFAMGTHLLTLLCVKSIWHWRMAFFVSLLFLVTPYETLTSTAHAIDYYIAFYSVACGWACYVGYYRPSPWLMRWGGFFFICAILVKVAGVLLVPPLVLASIMSGKKWKRWLDFWGASFICLGGVCFFYYLKIGHPFFWFTNYAYGDLPVSNNIFATLAIYPTYLLWKDHFGHWMFGAAGWLAIVGLLYCILDLWRRPVPPYWKYRPTPPVRFLFLGVVYLLLVIMAPHKISFVDYYSGQRIFRYLAQISPMVYVLGAFGLERIMGKGRSQMRRFLGYGLLLGIVGFGAYQTPLVSEPSWDSNRDGRALTEYFRQNPPSNGTMIQGDLWNCMRIQLMLYPLSSQWAFHCEDPETPEDRRIYFDHLLSGYLITGGGSLAWYSNRVWVMNLTPLNWMPPPSWQLVFERKGKLALWRSEPLRIWKIQNGDSKP